MATGLPRSRSCPASWPTETRRGLRARQPWPLPSARFTRGLLFFSQRGLSALTAQNRAPVAQESKCGPSLADRVFHIRTAVRFRTVSYSSAYVEVMELGVRIRTLQGAG